MRAAWSRSLGRAAALALGAFLAAHAAFAEEWHEAYRDGVQALARGDNTRAVESLRRAVALRPEPGRNLVTYGTNIEPRYFPYLRLAEAYLGLGQLDSAQQALEASALKQREPAEERHAIQARLDAVLASRRPPPPTPPPPTLAATLPSAPPRPPAETTTLASAPEPPPPTSLPAVVEPAPRLPRFEAPASRRAGPHPSPAPTEAPTPAPGAARVSGSIEIVSTPPGALVFLDDEPLGTTDPETGRLVKMNVAPGRHRARVALSGHEDAVREIELAADATASFYAMLKPRAPQDSHAVGWVAFGAVASALAAAVAWMLWRRPTGSEPLWVATPRPLAAAPSGTPATPSGNLNPGVRRDDLGQEWFGDFRLLGMLGRGGMASVYKVERAGELSALKRPLSSLLDDTDFVERFAREAEIGRTLNHPNIVRILARGQVDGVPYFTMELLAGQTLQALIGNSGAAEPRTAAAIVAQVAEALDFAHSKGVIHRDLKPSNIMVLTDGTAKVMDFGIARAKRFEALTSTGAFLGTPDYVAPEMIEGRGVEPRSDLYSLGAVFYELLTAQRPFSGETAFAILNKHCSEEARAPSQIRQGIPPELDVLVHRLLAKTPEERPANAEELVVALRDWLNRVA